MGPNPSLERDLRQQGTWPAKRCGPSSASRAKRLPGYGPSAQTLGVAITTEPVPPLASCRTALLLFVVQDHSFLPAEAA